jgi:serine/threonine protein kinase
MINHNNEAVLIDFGVSTLIDMQEDDSMGKNMGTYMFYSPEMFENTGVKGQVRGEKTDIWALGITLYYMLTGTYPQGKPEDL